MFNKISREALSQFKRGTEKGTWFSSVEDCSCTKPSTRATDNPGNRVTQDDKDDKLTCALALVRIETENTK